VQICEAANVFLIDSIRRLSVLFVVGAQPVPPAANPAVAGTQLMSNPAAAGTQPAASLQSADKYSAIADLESVFSSTSIGTSGFSFQGVGVNWAGGGVGVGGGVMAGGGAGGGAGLWGPQTAPFNAANTSQPLNLGQAAMPQMFAANAAPNAAVTPPSYSAVAGNGLCIFSSSLLILQFTAR